MSYLTSDELRALGVTAGSGVRVSRAALLFGAERIVLGDNVRVDAFCILSSGATGSIELGSHIHLAAGAQIFGQGGVTLRDFSSISSYSTVYSASDDYSGAHLMGPTIPSRFTDVDERPVVLERFAAIGSHAVVLPGVTLGEGAVLGAQSLAARSLDAWSINVGCPARTVGTREQGLVDKARELEDSEPWWSDG